MKKEDLLISIEIWKDIIGYENIYEINNKGMVRTKEKFVKDKWGRKYIKKSIICKPSVDNSGYKQIVLTKNGIRKSYKIHKLVAQAFIPNPNNLPEINHKDENKLNNNVDNLEWCSHKYNCNYGTRTYRCTRHRLQRVRQYNKQNDLIGEYPSIQDAEKITGIKYQLISGCCREKYKTAGGYIWKYC